MKIGKKIINNFEEYIFADTLPQDYQDITSILNFVKIGEYEFKDYKWIRSRLQEMSANWDNLSVSDRIILAKFKACHSDDAIGRQRSIEALGEDFNYWRDDYDRRSEKCREARFTRAKTILINNISVVDRYTILGLLDANSSLEKNYIKHGVEGLAYGDPVNGLYDFIEATNAFALTGIKSQTLTMIGNLTKDQMVNAMMDVLKNGNY